MSGRGSLLRPASRMSPTTPMIWRAGSVNWGPTPLPMRSCWPTGSPLGQYFFSMVSLIRTTPGAEPASCSVKTRPRRRGNAEDGEVAWGSAHPPGAAVPWRFAFGGAADDVEGQAVAALERKAAGEGGDFDAGDGIEALAPVLGDLGDSGGLFELVAGEGHFEGENVAGIEARVDLAESNEGADEERGSDEQHESE